MHLPRTVTRARKVAEVGAIGIGGVSIVWSLGAIALSFRAPPASFTAGTDGKHTAIGVVRAAREGPTDVVATYVADGHEAEPCEHVDFEPFYVGEILVAPRRPPELRDWNRVVEAREAGHGCGWSPISIRGTLPVGAVAQVEGCLADGALRECDGGPLEIVAPVHRGATVPGRSRGGASDEWLGALGAMVLAVGAGLWLARRRPRWGSLVGAFRGEAPQEGRSTLSGTVRAAAPLATAAGAPSVLVRVFTHPSEGQVVRAATRAVPCTLAMAGGETISLSFDPNAELSGDEPEHIEAEALQAVEVPESPFLEQDVVETSVEDGAQVVVSGLAARVPIADGLRTTREHWHFRASRTVPLHLHRGSPRRWLVAAFVASVVVSGTLVLVAWSFLDLAFYGVVRAYGGRP